MKKIMFPLLLAAAIFLAGKVFADLADPAPIVTLDASVINGMTVTINGSASTTCGEVKQNWCKLAHPGKGDGPFEIRWGDGAVSCVTLPASHDYSVAIGYEIAVKIKDSCGYSGDASTVAYPGATTSPITATSTATSTSTSTSTSTEPIATSTETGGKCASAGELTSGPVSPEYQFGCCVGLQPMTASDLLGAGQLCYDPTKGMPICQQNGTKSEGWYYPDGGLVKYDDCNKESVVCTKEYIPVCGEKQVQCVKAPCDPIKTTYGNRCESNAAGATYLYDGVCKVEIVKATSTVATRQTYSQAEALKEFQKIYKRSADLKNAKDAWAVSIMMFDLKVQKRNIGAEKQGLKIFTRTYGRLPKSGFDWSILRAITYSGLPR